MKFTDLQAGFSAQKITKPDYIQSAYTNFHQILFEYVSNLGNTDIKEITVNAEKVVFTVRSTGVKVICQHGDHRSPPFETFNFADFEPNESRMMAKLFEGSKIFYDVGANIGWHSLNLSAKFRKATFFCFEPIPVTFEHLRANIKLNAFTNIHTFNLALSDSNNRKDFYFYENCSGNASAVNLTERADVLAIACDQVRLDDFAREQALPAPDFIKCDVEGAELLFLKGALNVIEANRPIVMAEILRKWSAKYDYNPNQIFALFTKMGYQAYVTDGETLTPFGEMTEATAETNFFFLHPLQHAQKIQRFFAA